MTSIARTPKPPYYAVIFTARHAEDLEGYAEMAYRMAKLASKQDGFLGMETATAEIGITVSYWRDLDAIRAWKENTEHQIAQRLGRERWYASFAIRICQVQRDYVQEPSGSASSLRT